MDANNGYQQMDANKFMPTRGWMSNNGCQQMNANKKDSNKLMPDNVCQTNHANTWMPTTGCQTMDATEWIPNRGCQQMDAKQLMPNKKPFFYCFSYSLSTEGGVCEYCLYCLSLVIKQVELPQTESYATRGRGGGCECCRSLELKQTASTADGQRFDTRQPELRI